MVYGESRVVLNPGRCAVLGHPVGHSLSPLLHRAAYAELGLDWSYEAIDVEADQLPGFLNGLDGHWRGLSVTMPLKRAVVALVDELDPLAATVGVVNTVTFGPGRPGDRSLRRGSNTDVAGFAATLTGRPVDRVLVLGAGATACSLLAALPPDAEVSVLARGVHSGQQLQAVAARLGRAPVQLLGTASPDTPADRPNLLVSTLPAGAIGSTELAGLAGLLPGPGGTVLDVVYDGWPTLLARAAVASGAASRSGLDLLVHQAIGQVSSMTGMPVDVPGLGTVLVAALVAAGVPGARELSDRFPNGDRSHQGNGDTDANL